MGRRSVSVVEPSLEGRGLNKVDPFFSRWVVTVVFGPDMGFV